jgi:hypothetical protein
VIAPPTINHTTDKQAEITKIEKALILSCGKERANPPHYSQALPMPSCFSCALQHNHTSKKDAAKVMTDTNAEVPKL